MAPQTMMPHCRAVGRSTIAAGFSLSPRRRHSPKRRLSLKKKKRDSSEKTIPWHSVVHIALTRHHSRGWRLCCGVSGSHFNGRHQRRPLATNRRQMVLLDVGASRVSCTCSRISVHVLCGAANASHRTRRTTSADITLADSIHSKRSTVPCSINRRHNWSNVDAYRYLSASSCRKVQPALLSSITMTLVNSFVGWNWLRRQWTGILWNFTCPLW